MIYHPRSHKKRKKKKEIHISIYIIFIHVEGHTSIYGEKINKMLRKSEGKHTKTDD